MSKIVIGIIVFLLIGALMIKCSLDADLSEPDDRKTFGQAFWRWIKQLGSSSKETAEYAVKEQEWLPTNETIGNKTGGSNESQGTDID